MRRSGTLWEVLRLPRPQRYVWDVADDLCNGRSVLLSLPGHIPVEDVILAVEEHCRDRAQIESAYPPPSARWPEEWLMERFRIAGDPWAETAIGEIQRAPQTPPILILRDLDGLPSDVLSQWCRFLGEWANRYRRPDIPASERKAIFAIASKPEVVAALDEIGEDAFLRKAWYWGWVTSREVRVVAAEYLRERGFDETSRLWGESVWATLAGADWDCFLWLARRASVEMSLHELFEVLKGYGQMRFDGRDGRAAIGGSGGVGAGVEAGPGARVGTGTGRRDVSAPDDMEASRETPGERLWVKPITEMPARRFHAETAREAAEYGGAGALGMERDGSPLAPSHRERLPWLEGLWDWHDEGKRGLHSAALSLSGRRHTLEHRVWRGQAGVLLPMIDQVRIAVCEVLAARDPSWLPYRHKKEARLSLYDASSNSAELWTIESFLESQSAEPSLKRLKPMVSRVRRIRNSLAHYRPVEWEDFRAICTIFSGVVSHGEGRLHPAVAQT